MEVIKDVPVGVILKQAAGIIAVLSVFIQITPIKFNPLSILLKWIGSMLNEGTMKEISEIKKEINGVNSKVDNLEQKVKEVKEDMTIRLDNADARSEENNVCVARARVLRFGGEVIRGINHTKEEFDNILDDMDCYEKYCKEHPDFENNKTVAISKRIKDAYSENLINNGFLS